MKLLLDQGLPRSTASFLRSEGIDAIHVGELGLSTAKDSEILEVGQTQERIIVTLDADFHALLAFSGASGPSVIRIRIEGLRGQESANLILQVFNEIEEELDRGIVVTVQDGRLRFRSLPL